MQQSLIYDLDPEFHYIKIHGLQRTGTNFISKLINDNFENTKVLVNIGGWKHGYYCAPWCLGEEVDVTIVVKNPYAWLASIYKWWGPTKKFKIGPDLTGISFSEFIRNRAIFEEKDGTPYLIRATNPIQYWNNMNFHWLSIGLNHKQKCVIPWEMAIKNPESLINSLQDMFQLERKSAEIITTERELFPSEELQRITEKVWDKEYYSESKYLELYSSDDIAFVNQQIDKDIMEHIGYQLIDK